MKDNQSFKIEGLSSIIGSIKKELEVAQSEALKTPTNPKFLLSHMSIDISLVAESKDDTSGKFDFKIVSLSGSEVISDKAIHRVTLDFDIMEELDAENGEKTTIKPFYNR